MDSILKQLANPRSESSISTGFYHYPHFFSRFHNMLTAACSNYSSGSLSAVSLPGQRRGYIEQSRLSHYDQIGQVMDSSPVLTAVASCLVMVLKAKHSTDSHISIAPLHSRRDSTKPIDNSSPEFSSMLRLKLCKVMGNGYVNTWPQVSSHKLA